MPYPIFSSSHYNVHVHWNHIQQKESQVRLQSQISLKCYLRLPISNVNEMAFEISF